MEWDKLMLACEGSCQQKKTLKRYFFSFLFCQQKRSDRINSWCQTRTMERKSQLKTIKVKLFSVSLISLSRSCFRVLDGSNDEELVNPTQWRKDVLDVGVASATPQLLWGLAGDGVIVCCTLPPVTSSVCLGPVMLQEVTTRSDWWRKLTESWAHSSGLLTDMMEWFLSQKRAIMDFSPLPCPLKYWRLFLMDYLVLHLHRLHSLSSVPFSFYKCVFYCFSPLHDFPLELSLFFCFAVVWILPVCVWSHKFSVSKLSLSPLPVLSFDLMEFVFIQSLLLVNVQSVVFVQEKCSHQCNCLKC